MDMDFINEKGNVRKDEEYDFLEFGAPAHDDDSIARRKEQQKKRDKQRGGRPSME